MASQLLTVIGSTPSRSATSLYRKLLSDSASKQRFFEERLEALLQANNGRPVVREPLEFADTDVLFALADFPEPDRFHMRAGSTEGWLHVCGSSPDAERVHPCGAEAYHYVTLALRLPLHTNQALTVSRPGQTMAGAPRLRNGARAHASEVTRPRKTAGSPTIAARKECTLCQRTKTRPSSTDMLLL